MQKLQSASQQEQNEPLLTTPPEEKKPNRLEEFCRKTKGQLKAAKIRLFDSCPSSKGKSKGKLDDAFEAMSKEGDAEKLATNNEVLNKPPKASL